MSRLRPSIPWFRLAPLSGAIVADCSIDSSKLADSSVSADGIQDSAVTSIKIADSGVTTGDIADSAITSIKIADSGVTTGDIADSAITSIKIADSGVATGDIADCAVTTVKLNDSAVTYQKFQTVPAARLLGRYDAAAGVMQEIKLGTNLTFDSDDSELNAAGAALADCAVDSTKLADSAVSTDGIQDCAVTSAKIGDSQVGTAEIADCSVTSIKIADSGVGTGDIADSAITSAKIADGTIVGADIADSAIDSGKLSDSSVSTQTIQDSAVTTAKLDDAGVTYAKVQNVTAQRLLGREDALAGSIQEIALTAPLQFDTNSDALELADSGITGGFIADSAIDSSKLADCAVSNQTIADCAVDSTKIADSAVAYQNIQTVTARRVLGREDAVAGVVQEIALSAPLEFDTDADAIEIADCGITTVLLKDSSVDSSKLSDSAVSSAGIQDGTIVAADFYDTTIVTRIIELHATDTALAVGDTLATFFVPAEFDSFDLVRVAAAVKIASTAGTPTIQIRDVTGAADMLSTKLTIDTAEKTSYTAATAAVIDTTNDTLLAGQEIAIDIDSAGNAEDLYIILSARKY